MKQRRKRTSTKRIDLKKDQIIPFDELFELAKPEMNKIVKAFGATKVHELLDAKIEGDKLNGCIYGHLTGSCNSPEAVKFINENVKVHIYHHRDKKLLIGTMRSGKYFTPLEEFIFPSKVEYMFDDVEEIYSMDSYLERINKVKEYLKNLIDVPVNEKL
jgi:hypothetical protein